MKITHVKSCDKVETACNKEKVETCDEYQKQKAEASKHIQRAIDCLGTIAADDEIAKDSIANLGVVALDLSRANK